MELIFVFYSALSPFISREAYEHVVMFISIFLESNIFKNPSELPDKKNWSATFSKQVIVSEC